MAASLSQIRAWSTEHLVDAASYWTKTADQWENVFLQMRNDSYSVAWTGSGADGLRQRTSADLSIVSGKAEQSRQAAGIARNGASDISAAQRRVLHAIEDAQNAGFTVGEDLSVTDTRSGGTAADRAARQAQAQAFAGDIRTRAKQLDGAEARVTGQLTATTAGVGNTGFAQTAGSNRLAQASVSNRNGIQLVDFVKQDGGPSSPPQPGLPQPPQQPSFVDQYKQDLASPGPQSPPPPVPMPSFGRRPDPGPQPAPGPMPAYVPPPSFGQCVGGQVKANVGKDMVKGGFESVLKGAVTGAAGGAVLTPELLGAGALPGAVLGFVGGFAKGVIEAPIKAGIEGALECADLPISGLPKL